MTSNLPTSHRLQYFLHSRFAVWKSTLQMSKASQAAFKSTHGAEIYMTKSLKYLLFYLFI